MRGTVCSTYFLLESLCEGSDVAAAGVKPNLFHVVNVEFIRSDKSWPDICILKNKGGSPKHAPSTIMLMTLTPRI